MPKKRRRGRAPGLLQIIQHHRPLRLHRPLSLRPPFHNLLDLVTVAVARSRHMAH